MFEFQPTLDLKAVNAFRAKAPRAASRLRAIPDNDRIRVVRIAHASLTPALRGRERALARCYPQIAMEVIAPPRWRETGVDVETVPDDLFPVRTARTFLSKHIQLFAYDPFPIIDAFRRHKPHIIDMDHEPYSVQAAEIITLRNWFARDTPIVMQTAQNILKRYPPPFSIMERRALRQVSAAYMCSETVREVLDAKNFQGHIQIAPFGVDTEAFRPPVYKNNDTFTVGYVGRLMPEKGVHDLIAALAEIKDEKWRFLVVGDGPERSAMEKRLGDYGLLSRSEFVGAISYDQTAEYFQRLDVLVVPTKTTKKIREQFGRVIIEAMACQVPVIGSTCGAIPEVIADAGLIFPEGDPKNLSKNIRLLLHNPDLRSRLARSGRERVEKYYTWDRVAEKIFAAYTEVLAKERET